MVKLNKLFTPLFTGMLLGTTLLTSCTETVYREYDSQDGAMITLTMNSGAVITKTILEGYSNLQHATRAALYLFEYSETDNMNDATCTYVMDFDAVGWQQNLKEASTTGSITMQQRVSIPASVINPNKNYVILAIGSDESCVFDDGSKGLSGVTFKGDNSTATYGLTNGRLIQLGNSLGNCKAQLAEQKEYDDIHTSELFAGTLPVSGEQLLQTAKTTQVDLYRRVAGVQGFFTNIPSSVTLNGTVYPVTSLNVVYWTGQSEAVPFMVHKDATDPNKFVDYINKNNELLIPETGGTILATDVDKMSYITILLDDFAGSDDVPANAASYVLPAPAAQTTGNSTMYVLLLSKQTDGSSVVVMKKKVRYVASYYTKSSTRTTVPGTDGGTGIIIGQEGNQQEQEKEYNYNIVANEFYMLGTAQQPIDMGTGEQDVYLYVDPTWDGEHTWGSIEEIP